MTETVNTSVSIEVVGARLYAVGNTYCIKGRLKATGCHWDATRKQWWIGKAKRAKLEEVINTVNSAGSAGVSVEYANATAEELGNKPCSGRVTYKGRQYFVVGRDYEKDKLHLTIMDCSISFWVDSSACDWFKRYYPIQQYRGPEQGLVDVSNTVAKIRAFVESKRVTR